MLPLRKEHLPRIAAPPISGRANGIGAVFMPEKKAGSRLVGIILAAVVLLVLLGLLIYLVWRERNPKPKTVPQRASARVEQNI